MTNQKQLQKCTIRIDISDNRGTGFFVAPNLILTCHHVVGNNESIPIFWKETQQKYTATVEKTFEYPVDLALLKLDDNLKHPCIKFDLESPNLNDNLYIFGYPKDEGVNYKEGDSLTFKFAGESFKEDIKLYNLQNTEYTPSGFSSSPILNINNNKVCGIINLAKIDTGARGIYTEVIFAKFANLKELNQKFHQLEISTDSNPFQYGFPVQSKGFYGRKKVILHLKNRIGAKTPASVNIVGFRRSGKTSLLHYIQKCPRIFFQDSQKPLIVNLDLQSRKFPKPSGIIEGLRREITKLIGNKPWNKEDNNDDWEVEDALEKLVNQGYILIVMLDEFEAISPYFRSVSRLG